jgi:hypothetical protein
MSAIARATRTAALAGGSHSHLHPLLPGAPWAPYLQSPSLGVLPFLQHRWGARHRVTKGDKVLACQVNLLQSCTPTSAAPVPRRHRGQRWFRCSSGLKSSGSRRSGATAGRTLRRCRRCGSTARFTSARVSTSKGPQPCTQRQLHRYHREQLVPAWPRRRGRRRGTARHRPLHAGTTGRIVAIEDRLALRRRRGWLPSSARRAATRSR